MNKKKEEKAFSSEEVFDEILNKLENIPWLKEYAEQLPADFIIKILSIVLGFYGTKAVFEANVSMYKTYLETLIYPVSVIKIITLIVISYVLSLILLRGKIGKVDIVESLKDNRE